MKNVAYLLNSSQIGGGNRSLLSLWNEMKAHPINPVIFCPDEGPMRDLLTEEKRQYFIKPYYQPCWKNPFKTYINKRSWFSALRKLDISLVHANDLYNARSITQAAYSSRIPVLVHIRFPSNQIVCKWVFKNLPKPAGFIFNSLAMQKEVGGFLADACPTSRQWVVYNGVNLNAFNFTNQPNLQNEVIRIGIIGNFHPIKGHEDFFVMAKMLLDRGHKVMFDVIGDDIYGTGKMEEYKRMTSELRISNNVFFHGYINNTANIINELDIVVCSSHFESFGRCLIEAMACGKPVVATNVGGIPEVVEDQETGLLTKSRSPLQLADAVEKLLVNRDMRINMGKCGKDRANKLFSSQAHLKAIVQIYDTLFI